MAVVFSSFQLLCRVRWHLVSVLVCWCFVVWHPPCIRHLGLVAFPAAGSSRASSSTASTTAAWSSLTSSGTKSSSGASRVRVCWQVGECSGVLVSRCLSLLAVLSLPSNIYVVHVSICRTDADRESWWMTGTPESLYFFVLFRSTTHGQIRLQKMAGDLQDPCFAGALVPEGLGCSHCLPLVADYWVCWFYWQCCS